MKTIFTSLAISCTAFLYSQEAPPPVDWSQTYLLNNTSPVDITVDNSNVITFLALDQGADFQERIHLVKTDGTTILSDKLLKENPGYDAPFKMLTNSDNNYK